MKKFWKLTRGSVAKGLSLHESVHGIVVDDFLFQPYGYSLNAIKGDRYATFHITPQEKSSYVSFETNLNFQDSDTADTAFSTETRQLGFDWI